MSHRWSELESRASNEVIIPAWMRQLVSVVATASAAILYAIVLGIAVYRTFTEGQPQFSETMTRAAAALSGLVGSVVTAGFARGGSAAAIQVAGIRRDAVDVPVNLVKRSFTGLANTIGLPLLPELVLWTEPELGPGGEPVSDTPSFEVDEPAVNRTSLFLAILYFAVFFVVGLTAFVTSIARPSVPELLANCAWVWLGSIITSGYAFFTLSGESATN